MGGGKDGTAMLWDLNEGKRLYSLDAGDIIHSLVFSPNRYWLCAATTLAIKIWDLESKVVVDELKPEFPAMGKNATAPYCTSICWSADGAVSTRATRTASSARGTSVLRKCKELHA